MHTYILAATFYSITKKIDSFYDTNDLFACDYLESKMCFITEQKFRCKYVLHFQCKIDIF